MVDKPDRNSKAPRRDGGVGAIDVPQPDRLPSEAEIDENQLQRDYTLAEGTALGDLYRERVEKNQDLVVLVDDKKNRRGTGKTTLSLKLAKTFDRTDEGVTADKCSIAPQDLVGNYTEKPKGSALVLDEAEAGVSKYAASSKANMAVRNLVSMGRIEQKYVVINLPASGMLDRDLKALCDVWIMVTERGQSVVHELDWNPYGEHMMTPIKGTLAWTDIDDPQLTDVYEALTAEKREHLRGDSQGDEFVDREELERATDQAKKDERNEIIRDVYQGIDGVTQQDIADAVGLSRSRVADILSG